MKNNIPKLSYKKDPTELIKKVTQVCLRDRRFFSCRRYYQFDELPTSMKKMFAALKVLSPGDSGADRKKNLIQIAVIIYKYRLAGLTNNEEKGEKGESRWLEIGEILCKVLGVYNEYVSARIVSGHEKMIMKKPLQEPSCQEILSTALKHKCEKYDIEFTSETLADENDCESESVSELT